MASFIDSAPAQNLLVTVLMQKLQAIESMPAAKRGQVRARAEKIVADQVYPAYRSASAELQSQLPAQMMTPDSGA